MSDEVRIRQPIIAVLGHVDHGKTTFLDRIRQTAVADKEAGQITQAIGASVVPKGTIEKLCGPLLEKFKFSVQVPGLLFIDTPGHEAFTSLRKRGGALADMAVLVIDIMEGLMPQTEESLRILKEEKTPFVVAINKVDRIKGWHTREEPCNFENQQGHVRQEFEERFYKIVEQISRFGFSCDRFDRVTDFKRTVAAVPMSGKSGEGIAEVLAMLVGLSQTFLKKQLELTAEGKGFVLEVKETTGLGKTIDVILYDGSISKGDWLVVGGCDPFVTHIKALLMPKPLKEIRTETQFLHVDLCCAACGIKISAPDLERARAGAEIVVRKTKEEAENAVESMRREREEAEVHRDIEGIALKADTIGSLEALLNILKEYPIKDATIGCITKNDVILVSANSEEKNKIIIAFNTPLSNEVQEFAKRNGVAIIETDIIYHVVEEYQKFIERLAEEIKQKEISSLTMPAQIHIMPGYVFRQNNPAIVGCEVRGVLRPGVQLLKEGRGVVGTIKQIQKEGNNVEEAKTGEKVAVGIEGATVGRQIEEGDYLYTDVGSEDYKKMMELKEFLTEAEKQLLEEIAQLKRKEDKRYGL